MRKGHIAHSRTIFNAIVWHVFCVRCRIRTSYLSIDRSIRPIEIYDEGCVTRCRTMITRNELANGDEPLRCCKTSTNQFMKQKMPRSDYKDLLLSVFLPLARSALCNYPIRWMIQRRGCFLHRVKRSFFCNFMDFFFKKLRIIWFFWVFEWIKMSCFW